MEVWLTSNLRPLRLGEEKKIVTTAQKYDAPLLHRAAINRCKRLEQLGSEYKAVVCVLNSENFAGKEGSAACVVTQLRQIP